MRKILSLTLAVLLLAALLAGCGGSSGGSAGEASIVGSWATEIDMSDDLNEELSTDETMAKYVNITGFTVRLLAEFREDGTYSFQADPEAMETSMDSLRAQLREAVTAYLQDLLTESGVDTPVDEFLADQGTSLDEFMEEFNQFVKSEDIIAAFSTEGCYLYENGKLATTDSTDEPAVMDDDADDAEVTADTLTLNSDNENDRMNGFYPMVFDRQ